MKALVQDIGFFQVLHVISKNHYPPILILTVFIKIVIWNETAKSNTAPTERERSKIYDGKLETKI